MRQLRIGLIALASLGLVACDDGDGGTDSGPPVGIDSGPPSGVDAGPPTGTDAGPPSTGTCGPVGGECMITPGAGAATACTADPMSGAARGCLLVGGGANPWMTQCAAVGVVPEGGDCDPTMVGQCGAGFECLGDPGSATCARLCCSNTDCAPGDRCVALSGAGPDGMEAGTCRTPVTCDPLNTTLDGSNGCPTGQACFTVGDSLDCFTPGTATVGQACMALNACVAGHGCYSFSTDMMFLCRELCDPMAMPTTCPAGMMCNALTGFTDLGACIMMPAM